MSALDSVLALLPQVATSDSNAVAEAIQRVGAVPVALAILARISPSGALATIAEGNPELDAELDHFDADERALTKLLEPGIVDRLEDDFAMCVPAIADAAVPLEAWAIPLLETLGGPFAIPLGFGLTLACKVATLALKAWAAKRLARKGS